jgi:hypothetical protein
MAEEIKKGIRKLDYQLDGKEGEFNQRKRWWSFDILDETKTKVIGVVTFKLNTYPVVHLEFTAIEVEEELRGLSTDELSGYGGTIVEEINRRLERFNRKGLKVFAILWNQTPFKNKKHPQVIDFYYNKGWVSFDEDFPGPMYYAPNKDELSEEEFQELKEFLVGMNP